MQSPVRSFLAFSRSIHLPLIVGLAGVTGAGSGLAACGSSNSASGFETPDAGLTTTTGAAGDDSGAGGGSLASGAGGDDGGSPIIVTSSDGGGNDDGCTDANKLVYVVDEENVLHSFNPQALTFATIGTLQCNSTSTPNSMAVDRSGVAWVNYSDGHIFKVSTTDASCTSTTFAVNQHSLGKQYGMAFASNTAGSTDETLYVVGMSGSEFSASTGKGLATIDTTSLILTPVADFTNGLKGSGAELTGTGNATLFGFFETTPASLAQITEATAATPTKMSLSGVETGDAFAFSFWGGDFWFYTAGLNSSTSDVTQLKASSDNSLTVVLHDVGFNIVGAGVSTCAPTVPPPIR